MEKSCCFFGLTELSFDKCDPQFYYMSMALQVKWMIDAGVKTFYSGLMPGIDVMCAKCVLPYLADNPEVRLHVIIAPDVLYGYMSPTDMRWAFHVVRSATSYEQISGLDMERWARLLIENSTHMFAVYPEAVSTFTVQHAKECGLDVTELSIEQIEGVLKKARSRRSRRRLPHITFHRPKS